MLILADTQIISQLIQEELYDEAIKFLALGLPKRRFGGVILFSGIKVRTTADVQNALRGFMSGFRIVRKS